MTKLVTASLGASLLILAACASAPEKKIDYRTSDQSKRVSLEVPPDLVAPSANDPAARRGSATLSTFDARQQITTREAPARLVDPQAGLYVARAGNERWLVAKGSPAELWPKLRSFWQDTGFSLSTDQPALLVMETDWAENRANIPEDGVRRMLGTFLDNVYGSGTRDRFRTRVEPGAEAGTVEIYISHRGAEEVYVNQRSLETRWQPRAPDPDLEAEMLVRMMIALGSPETEARKRLEASKAAPERATLQTGEIPLLIVQQPLDTGWRQVGLTLDRVGLVVEDRDRAKGFYSVRYVLPKDLGQESTGFWSKLAFWGSKKDTAITGTYRIAVSGDAKQTQVKVLDKDGAPEKGPAAQQILAILHEQMK